MRLCDHPFFAGLDCADSRSLIRTSVTERFPAGAVLFDEGIRDAKFCLILEGRVRFEKRSSESDRKYCVVGEYGPGDAFGELALVSGGDRLLRATAIDDALVAFPDPAELCRIRALASPVARRFDAVMAAHMGEILARYADDAVRQERLVSLGSMTGSIAHDLRAPLTVINLNAQLIETVAATADSALGELLRKRCRNIELQVERMMGMLEEVADFSRGRSHDEYSRIDLRELFETFRFLSSTQWETSGVAVEFRCDGVVIDADPRKLLRVLQNLVGNAVDALADAVGGRVIVSAGLLDERTAFMRVEDNGPGIPESIREIFWEPFVTSGKARGTGLGTAICKSLVEAHGGSIGFETETGRGTRFLIEIPVNRPAYSRGDGAPSFLRSSNR